jgi:hypothetical protein
MVFSREQWLLDHPPAQVITGGFAYMSPRKGYSRLAKMMGFANAQPILALAGEKVLACTRLQFNLN